MYKIDVIEDFTSQNISTQDLSLSYDQDKTVTLKSLKENLYRISKKGSELFEQEYKNASPQSGNNPVAFLENIERKNDNTFVINASRGDYKMVIALRNFLQKYDNQNRRISKLLYLYVTPIGLGVVTTTKDNYLLVSRRGDEVDVPGALINYWVGNLDQEGMGRMPTIEERLQNRAFVKVGLESNDYVIRRPLGIFRDRQQSHNPAVMYSGYLPDLTVDQVKAKLERAKLNSKFADKEVIAIELDEKKVREHLVKEAPKYVGNGLIAILYRLKEIFGTKFFFELVEDNKKVFKVSDYSFRKV